MTISRVNLCRTPIPTLDPDFFTESWYAVPAGDWAINLSGHATLPRQTVFAGTTTGAVRCSPVPVVPGRTYVASMSMRAVAANTVSIRVLWITGTGVIISISAATAYTQAASTTVRMATPALVAPVNNQDGDAVLALLEVTGIDGSAQLTAAMFEQASTAGTYFDGNTSGAAWAGTTNLSPSTIGTTDLALEIGYDETLGRVRTFVTGGVAAGGRAMVRRRLATEKNGQIVRGGADLDGGVSLRSVDDYEFPAGPPLVYRLEVYSGRYGLVQSPTQAARGQFPESPIETLEVSYTPPRPRAWLKFMASPQLNRKITITGWEPIERPSRNTLYDIQDAPEPLVVTSGHSSRRTTLTLRTWTPDETRALDESMRQGIPALLHLPDDSTLPTMYCVVGTYRHAPPSRRSLGAVWTVPIIEVAAPPASIFAAASSWQTVINANATWADLLDDFDTWREVGA
jgi:hypothetical protein